MWLITILLSVVFFTYYMLFLLNEPTICAYYYCAHLQSKLRNRNMWLIFINYLIKNIMYTILYPLSIVINYICNLIDYIYNKFEIIVS